MTLSNASSIWERGWEGSRPEWVASSSRAPCKHFGVRYVSQGHLSSVLKVSWHRPLLSEHLPSQTSHLQTELPQLNVNNYLYKIAHFFFYWLNEVTINMKKGITLILSLLYVPSSVGFPFVRCFCCGRHSWKARRTQTSGRWIDTPQKSGLFLLLSIFCL